MDSLSRSPVRDTLVDDAPDKLYKPPKTLSCHGCHCDLSWHPLRPTSTSSMATLRPTRCIRYVAAVRGCPVVLRCDQQRTHKLGVFHEFWIQPRLRTGKGDEKPAWPSGHLNRSNFHGVGMWDRIQFHGSVRYTDVAVGTPSLYNYKQHENPVQGAPWDRSFHNSLQLLGKFQGTFQRRDMAGNSPAVTEAIKWPLHTKSQRPSTYVTDPLWVQNPDVHQARVIPKRTWCHL
jgi:hypothetical protein